MKDLTFRAATEEDTALILHFVQELARYENKLDEVTATENMLRDFIFGRNAAEAVFAMKDGREVGFALYFFTFSTFMGRSGLFIEDFVYPSRTPQNRLW